MTSECILFIPVGQDIHFLHCRLKEHVIIHNPPYSIVSIMAPYMSSTGRQIRIVIDHSSRNVNIVEGSIREHVLQTTILAFQQHRLQTSRTAPPRLPLTNHRPPQSSPQLSGQDCAVCLDPILHRDISTLPCAHSFHRHCIQTWFGQHHNTCPVCRYCVS